MRIDRLGFLRALTRVRCLSDGKVTVKITEDDSFIVTSNEETRIFNDPALQIRSRIFVERAANEKDLIFTFDARKLSALVKSLSGEDFEITLKNGKAVIKESGSRFNLEIHEKDLTPDWPEISNFRKVSTAALSYLIRKSIYAISGKEDDTRFYDSSLFLDAGDEFGLVRMVATNGHLLAMAEVREEALSADLPSDGLLLTHRGMKALFNLLDVYGEEEDVEYGFTDSMAEVRFVDGETVLSMGFVDRKYPDYRHILSKTEQDHVLRLSSDVLGALQRIAILSDSVSFAAAGNIEVSSAVVTDGESAYEKIPGEYLPGSTEEIAVAFNGKYISTILKEAFDDSEKVDLLIKDVESPILIKGEGSEDFHHLALLMPMKI